ncbi:MAG: hypothetical protein AAF757_18755 [Cyanobacteria bacterium P01_D01_bin.116]
MQTVLWEIINAPYQGIVQRVYLESKTLELLALQLAQFIETEEKVTRVCNLKAGEIEKIHQAKEILINNITEPPTLLDLAEQVGIYHMKLKQGFRQLLSHSKYCKLNLKNNLEKRGHEKPETSIFIGNAKIYFRIPTYFSILSIFIYSYRERNM